MHHIEMGNDETTFEFVITKASRDTLRLIHAQVSETVRTEAYVQFARDLTRAFHALKGLARLQNEAGRVILSISFERGHVEVETAWGKATNRFRTDQSYLTRTVGQIGIVE
ncbi:MULTISPECIES: hypothetical protein [Exiguobacterium]|uniref:hypothetical protein n=1 Tax=Exiguobacterium TaxID=33986 RepID=UPI001BE538CC|nr:MULTISPECIES: hypothetical protein [Exiguobacterium]MCT4777426.1 hypothetical protein [Exiguobacterium aquaticum]MCT4790020.1 hypothetical protein [Exiguobacterium mexicanum]